MPDIPPHTHFHVSPMHFLTPPTCTSHIPSTMCPLYPHTCTLHLPPCTTTVPHPPHTTTVLHPPHTTTVPHPPPSHILHTSLCHPRYKQEFQKSGKGSFAYACVLDETGEERHRGITMDVAQQLFETKSKLVTLLDAPGHKDFIPNMSVEDWFHLSVCLGVHSVRLENR